MHLADLYYVTVSISAVAATIAFIISVWKNAAERGKENAERRNAAIATWQRALIQRIFQNADKELSFETIQQRYRSEAVAYGDYDLRGDDLSPHALRRILIDMLTDRIIEQLGADKYALSVPQSNISAMKELMGQLQTGIQSHLTEMTAGMLETMKEVMGQLQTLSQSHLTEMTAGMLEAFRVTIPAHIATEQKVEQELLRMAADNPFRYNVAEVSIQIGQRLQLEIEAVRALVFRALVKKYVVTDDRGRVGPRPNDMAAIDVGGDDN